MIAGKVRTSKRFVGVFPHSYRFSNMLGELRVIFLGSLGPNFIFVSTPLLERSTWLTPFKPQQSYQTHNENTEARCGSGAQQYGSQGVTADTGVSFTGPNHPVSGQRC